jgi:fermentation-respiration switch protein FrsA (DUF1100 family)
MIRYILLIIVFYSTLFCQEKNFEILSEGLLLKILSSSGVISPDKITASILLNTWKAPAEGDEVISKSGVTSTWEIIKADENGWFSDDSLYNGYIYIKYDSDEEKVVLLEAMGNSMVYVNGTPRSGNPYSSKDTYENWEPRFDYSLLPVKLNKGKNDLIFLCNRGVLKVKLVSVQDEIVLNKEDLTLPDLIVNQSLETYGAIPVINTTENVLRNLSVKTWTENSEPVFYKVNNIQPLSIYKTPFHVKLPASFSTGKVTLNIQLIDSDNKVLASAETDLRIHQSNESYKETFISRLDGSVQYYAVNPAEDKDSSSALYLSLHGAGVEAINQAQSYAQKKDGYIVAPTNRRPYGFNWENWGRIDALEVLDIAKSKFKIDKSRIYLTGHSMGGHGTWHLGINYPDRFAAIGPSAGWISIWSYRIRPDMDSTDIYKMLARSTKQSDTYAFAENLKINGIYIIHGLDDDNVPAAQAESMVKVLSTFHKDFIYHQEPGAGHWWDKSDKPGADCVDWEPMFEFFGKHNVVENSNIDDIDFITANLAVSSSNYWIRIINQTEQMKLSRIKIALNADERKFTGTTENIDLLEIDASMFDNGDVSVELDQQLVTGIKLPADHKIYFRKDGGKWIQGNKYSKADKYPERCGSFREVLNNNGLFVYGTKGNDQENKWAFEKARYDAERLWYQGNGSIQIIKDSEFNPVKFKDRNVILFGNSITNSAWSLLINNENFFIDNNKIRIGDKEFLGEETACLVIRPRKDSEIASVGVVSGTGITGMNLAGLVSYYHPYTNFPDIVIFNKDITSSDEEGILFTGFFGNDWSIKNGEFIEK